MKDLKGDWDRTGFVGFHKKADTPVLQALFKTRAVGFWITPANTIVVEEQCDNHFASEMTLEEFDGLLLELVNVRKQLKG